MQRAREQTRAMFQAESPDSSTREKVESLLDQDRFMCGTGGRGGDEVSNVKHPGNSY